MIKKRKNGGASLSGTDVMVDFSFLKPVISFILVNERKMSYTKFVLYYFEQNNL